MDTRLNRLRDLDTANRNLSILNRLQGAKPALQKVGQLGFPLDTHTRRRRMKTGRRKKQRGGCGRSCKKQYGGKAPRISSGNTGGIVYAKGSWRDRYGAILYDPRT